MNIVGLLLYVHSDLSLAAESVFFIGRFVGRPAPSGLTNQARGDEQGSLISLENNIIFNF